MKGMITSQMRFEDVHRIISKTALEATGSPEAQSPDPLHDENGKTKLEHSSPHICVWTA